MTSNTDKDDMKLTDQSGRRRFIRTGSALLLAGAALHTQQALADCDRAGGEKNPEDPNTDSDAGAEADAAGCGRHDPPVISRHRRQSIEHTPVVTIKRS